MYNKDQNINQSVAVIGMGVVGLPTALMLATAGYSVTGVDINKNIVDSLNKQVLPSHINEDKLQAILKDPRVKENLKVVLTPSTADVFIIAVPTPLKHIRKMADLSYVKNAIKSILPFLKKGGLIIVESTVPPLTCRKLIKPMIEKTGLLIGKTIFLAYCPERVMPGNICHEIVHNDRIVGGINEQSCEMAENLYLSFVNGNIYKTDDVTAEYCKLMENAYRDVNIALANEFSSIAEELKVDPKIAIRLANRHPRVNILNPGIGVGGHCIPIDPWFIYEVSSEKSKLIPTARKINDGMPSKIASKIRRAVKNIDNPKIIAIGAAYKADTSDVRESPAIKVVKILRRDGYTVEHYDPLIDKYKYPRTLVDSCLDADLLVILVPHKIVLEELNTYREKITTSMRTPKILEF